MSSKSRRLYTTVSSELGGAFEALAKMRMISEAELLRQIVSEYVTQHAEGTEKKRMMLVGRVARDCCQPPAP